MLNGLQTQALDQVRSRDAIGPHSAPRVQVASCEFVIVLNRDAVRLVQQQVAKVCHQAFVEGDQKSPASVVQPRVRKV